MGLASEDALDRRVWWKRMWGYVLTQVCLELPSWDSSKDEDEWPYNGVCLWCRKSFFQSACSPLQSFLAIYYILNCPIIY